MKPAKYILYFAVLTLFFPSVVWYLVEANEGTGNGLVDSPILVMSTALLLYSAIRLVYLSDALPNSFMGLCFFVFIYIWLGLIPIYQLSTGQLSWGIILPVEYYHLAFILVFLGIAAYELGYKLRRLRTNALAYPIPTLPLRRIAVFSLLAVAVAAWLGPLTTPIDQLMSAREDVIVAMTYAGKDMMSRLLTLSIMRTPILLALLITLWSLRVERHNRYLLLLLLVIVPLFLIVNYPTAIDRSWLGTCVISVTLVFIITGRRPIASIFPLGLICALLTIYPLATYARSSSIGIYGSVPQAVIDTYSAGSFDVFSMIAHTVYYMYAVKEPITWGYQLLGALLFWVPRIFWSEKPVGSGQMIAEALGFDFTNVSAPLWTEGIVNFGYPGVALFFIVFGYLSRSLDMRITGGQPPSINGLSVVFLVGFQFMILRGDLMTVTMLGAPYFALLLGLFWWPYRRNSA